MAWNRDVAESPATPYIVPRAGDRTSEATGGIPDSIDVIRAWISWRCVHRVKFFICAGVAGPVIWRASGPVDIYRNKIWLRCQNRIKKFLKNKLLH